MTYYIYFSNRLVTSVDGCEAAWHAYRLAEELGDYTGEIVSLVYGETGEVIQSSDEED